MNNIDLKLALQYDSYGEKYLGDFERMLIQKKRSANLNEKKYELPPELETKIQEKLNYIQKKKWESPQY
jgi:hypothetical protein